MADPTDGTEPVGVDDEFRGRVVVVTGASRGLGRELVLAYVARGARVVASARGRTGLEELAASAGGMAGSVLTVSADARRHDGASAPVRQALEEFGTLDVLVNNVGGTQGGDQDPFTCADRAVDDTVALTLLSPWWTTHAALPAMRDAGGGRVLNIGSGSSIRAGSSVGYTMAKHGLVGLTRSLAVGVASAGITVNCLCPGWMRTPRIDFEALGERAGLTAEEAESSARADSALGVILDPAQLCEMALLLTGPIRGAAITGQVVNVDGGYRL